jgi:hypothetical protein
MIIDWNELSKYLKTFFQISSIIIVCIYFIGILKFEFAVIFLLLCIANMVGLYIE